MCFHIALQNKATAQHGWGQREYLTPWFKNLQFFRVSSDFEAVWALGIFSGSYGSLLPFPRERQNKMLPPPCKIGLKVDVSAAAYQMNMSKHAARPMSH